MSAPLKVAVVVYEPLSGDVSRVYRGLRTALELHEAGDDIALLFDGSGVETLAAISDPANQMHPLLTALADRVQGACAFCAGSHKVADTIKEHGWNLLTDFKGEASVRKLLAAGYHVINF